MLWSDCCAIEEESGGHVTSSGASSVRKGLSMAASPSSLLAAEVKLSFRPLSTSAWDLATPPAFRILDLNHKCALRPLQFKWSSDIINLR